MIATLYKYFSKLLFRWSKFISSVMMNLPVTITLLPVYFSQRTFVWLLPISLLLDIIFLMLSYLSAYRNVLQELENSSIFQNSCRCVSTDNLSKMLEFYRTVCKEQRLAYFIPTFVGVRTTGIIGGYATFPFVDGSVVCISDSADTTDQLTETLIAHELLHCFTHPGFRTQAKMQRIIALIAVMSSLSWSIISSNWWMLIIVIIISFLVWYYAEEEVDSKIEMDSDLLSLKWIDYKHGKEAMRDMASIVLEIRIRKFIKCPKTDKKHLMLFNSIQNLMPLVAFEERREILSDLEKQYAPLIEAGKKELHYKFLLLMRAFRIDTMVNDIGDVNIVGVSPASLFLLPILFAFAMTSSFNLLKGLVLGPCVLWLLVVEIVVIVLLRIIRNNLWKRKMSFLNQHVI